MASEDIIRKALEEEDPIVVEEVVKYTSFKYLGTSTNVDLYIHTAKKYVETKIKSNILIIKDVVQELEGKTVRDVYINRIKQELELKPLKSKKNTIGLIDISDISNDKTSEFSGENDIVDEIFKYESSVLSKSKVTLHLHNPVLNREWVEEVQMSVVKNKLSIKRRALYNKIKQLIDLKYVANNNDTKEVIELLGLN